MLPSMHNKDLYEEYLAEHNLGNILFTQINCSPFKTYLNAVVQRKVNKCILFFSFIIMICEIVPKVHFLAYSGRIVSGTI